MKRMNNHAQRKFLVDVPPSPSVIAIQLSVVFAGTAAIYNPDAAASPTGGNVVAGQATISQPAAGQTQIRQSTQRAIIDWQSFGIGRGESVNFAQPSTRSATLNRVIGNDPSAILGSMRANGQVFLVNQNGVYVGPGAQIDVGGLVLSTANIGNNNFMAGRLIFDQAGKPDAKVVNEGQITVGEGGLLAMVAPGVQNSGVISARLGTVILAGARTYSLDLYGDGLINLVIPPDDLARIADATGRPLSYYVDHSGAITAEGGRVLLSAGAANNLVNSAVNVPGTIHASRPAGKGGSVSLLAGSRLDVSGQVLAAGSFSGGSIEASAENVVLGSGALLDASGGAQGGQIYVGGNFQGASPVAGASATASKLNVASGARIKADATGRTGNGGTVVLWSDHDTRFSGIATAAAGAMAGDGGLIEVSGKDKLAFLGSANASAPAGRPGTLLLDPGTLTVSESGGGSFSASGSDSTVSAAIVSETLRGGTSVSLMADDDLRINALVDARPFQGTTQGTTGAGLSLNAGRSIEVNLPIVLNGGAFTANARRGSFTQAATAPIVSIGADGNAFANAPFEITAAQGITAHHLATTGNVSLRSDNGSIGLTALVGGTDPAAQIGNFSASAVNGELTLAGVGSRGTATVKGLKIARLGDIYAAGGIDIGATGGEELKLDSLQTINGPINVVAGGAIVLPTSESIRSAGANIALASGSRVTAAGVIAANDLNPPAAEARHDLTINGVGDVKVAQVIASGKTSITSAQGGIELSESLGGPDEQQPRLGSLYLTAWGNIVTRGLNLAGTPTGAQDSLVLEAGTRRDASGNATFNPGGGTILVADRIGVSEGDIRFGANDPQVVGDEFKTVLQQGVYARRGSQSITFNVPIETDGSQILRTWRKILGDHAASNGAAMSEKIVDMMLIPRDAENPFAENAVINKEGGYLVAVKDNLTLSKGEILRICPTSGCNIQPNESANEYWMIPKIVISNQDGDIRPSPEKKYGAISLARQLPSESAALKLIVPASEEEAKATIFSNGLGYRAIFYKTTVRPADCNEADLCTVPSYGRIDNIKGMFADQIPLLMYARTSGQTQNSQLASYQIEYWGGVLDIPEVIGGESLQRRPHIPVSLALYPGRLSSDANFPRIDNGSVFPTTKYEPNFQAGTDQHRFASNSAPLGFSATGPGAISLQDQILASLIPKAPVAGGTGSGQIPTEVVATGRNPIGTIGSPVSAIDIATAQELDQKINIAQSEGECDAQIRTVVGRSSGDEADRGTTSALYGAARPVLRTRYSLGSVSPSMANSADAPSIGGATAGLGGGASCM